MVRIPFGYGPTNINVEPSLEISFPNSFLYGSFLFCGFFFPV